MDAPETVQHNISYRHFDLPAHFPVLGLLGDSWKGVRDSSTRIHFHNCLEIGYLYQGSCTCYIGPEAVHAQAPCIAIMPPHVPHGNQVDEGSETGWKWLYVDPLMLLPQLSPTLVNAMSLYQRTLSGEDCILPAADHPKIYALTQLIIDEMEKNEKYHHGIVRELLYALFLMLLRVSPKSELDEHRANMHLGCIAPAITYIAENYMNDITIEALSDLCHVSSSHFRRLFKQALGWAPFDYIQVVRIDRACVLLYNCDNSVTDIGMEVGYSSPSSFTRQFRRVHGVSPSQWRQKMRSEENPIVTAYFNSVPPTIQQFFPDGTGV